LTLGLGLVVALALIAFTLAVYGLLARSLAGEIDQSLADRAQEISHAMQRQSRSPSRRRVTVPRPVRFASAGAFVQVSSLDGQVLGDSGNLGDARLPIDADATRAVRAGRAYYEVVRLQGEPVRLYSAPVIVQNAPTEMVQVARSLEPVERSLARLRWLAGAGLLITLALSALGIWLTMSRTLRPLEHLIDTAAAIGSSGDLTRRVAPPSSTDEVGRLAAMFNRMLGRLETSDAELRAAYSQVERALEAQRRFVADASHELRTPLTTIRGNASLLRQFAGVTPEDRAAALAQIGNEAERMSRLVQDLLTLARADAGQPLARVPVALAPLVEEVVAQARVLAHGQQLLMDSLPPIEAPGDPDALRQLALILLDNALKYTPPGGRILVRLEAVGDEARLAVSDTGVGIAAEDLPHIFERFYRADHARQAGGAGLGLSIAASIAARHGGALAVTSTPGRGSTFTVRLPQARGRPAPGEPPPRPQPRDSHHALTST
jgi:signal transduction histidine kinase